MSTSRTSLGRRSMVPVRKTGWRHTMQYLLLIYSDEAATASVGLADAKKVTGAYEAYTEAMKKAGVWVGGERLRPTSAATTLRGSNGSTKVLNGPYAETREQLGGYYMIDVPDLDAALSWASRCPGTAHGSIEVRPVWPHSEYLV